MYKQKLQEYLRELQNTPNSPDNYRFIALANIIAKENLTDDEYDQAWTQLRKEFGEVLSGDEDSDFEEEFANRVIEYINLSDEDDGEDTEIDDVPAVKTVSPKPVIQSGENQARGDDDLTGNATAPSGESTEEDGDLGVGTAASDERPTDVVAAPLDGGVSDAPAAAVVLSELVPTDPVPTVMVEEHGGLATLAAVAASHSVPTADAHIAVTVSVDGGESAPGLVVVETEVPRFYASGRPARKSALAGVEKVKKWVAKLKYGYTMPRQSKAKIEKRRRYYQTVIKPRVERIKAARAQLMASGRAEVDLGAAVEAARARLMAAGGAEVDLGAVAEAAPALAIQSTPPKPCRKKSVPARYTPTSSNNRASGGRRSRTMPIEVPTRTQPARRGKKLRLPVSQLK